MLGVKERIVNEKRRKNDIRNEEETKKTHQATKQNDTNRTPPADSTVISLTWNSTKEEKKDIRRVNFQ